MKIPNSVVLLRSWFRRSALGSRSQRDGVVTWIFFFRRRFFPWNIHPWRLTWNLKITCLKRKIIFQTSIFGFHVDFQGCTDLIVFVWKPFFFFFPGVVSLFFFQGVTRIYPRWQTQLKNHTTSLHENTKPDRLRIPHRKNQQESLHFDKLHVPGKQSLPLF